MVSICIYAVTSAMNMIWVAIAVTSSMTIIWVAFAVTRAINQREKKPPHDLAGACAACTVSP